jgi:hypothetical protein
MLKKTALTLALALSFAATSSSVIAASTSLEKAQPTQGSLVTIITEQKGLSSNCPPKTKNKVNCMRL